MDLCATAADLKERAERTSQMRSGTSKSHLQETKSEGGAQQLVEGEYSDEYIYDHAILWDVEGFEGLPASDCRSKWSSAVIAFFQWLADEQKRRGREVMPPAPQRNIALFASRSFISMKNWFSIMTDRGYTAPLKKSMAIIEEETEEEAREEPVEVAKVSTTKPAPSPLPEPSPRAKRLRDEVESPPAHQSAETRSRLTSPPKPTPSAHTASSLDAHSSRAAAPKHTVSESPKKMPDFDAVISSTPPRKQSRTEAHEAQQASSPTYLQASSAEKARSHVVTDLALLKDLIDAEFTRHHSSLESMKQQINTYQEQLATSKALMYRLCGFNGLSN